MKINEVFANLIKNPNEVYEAIADSGWRQELSINPNGYFHLKIFNKNGELVDYLNNAGGFNGNIKVTADWQLARKPVTFMEAVNALKIGKAILCEKGNITPRRYENSGTMKDQFKETISVDEILCGNWYIE